MDTAICSECGRRFDLTDETDAQEWAYGHDCEPLCAHVGEERATRTAHGHLGDAPAGTVQVLCAACGTVLEEVPPAGAPITPEERADARQALARIGRDPAAILEALEADGILRVVDQ